MAEHIAAHTQDGTNGQPSHVVTLGEVEDAWEKVSSDAKEVRSFPPSHLHSTNCSCHWMQEYSKKAKKSAAAKKAATRESNRTTKKPAKK